jgi:hypothetical protein
MEVDGRLERLLTHSRLFRKACLEGWGSGNSNIYDPKPCVNCKRMYKPLRKGRCSTCAKHYYRTGEEWSKAFIDRLCCNCGVKIKALRARRCGKCQWYFSKHGIERPPKPGRGPYAFSNTRGRKPICEVCGKTVLRSCHGRCKVCYNFWRRTGKDRTSQHLEAAASGRKFYPKAHTRRSA